MKVILTLFFTLNASLAFTQSTGFVLAKSYGGSSYEIPTNMAVDQTGDYIAVGTFSSPFVAFGPDTIYNPGGITTFIAKFDATNSPLWAKSAVGGGQNAAKDVITDASGNIFATGYFTEPSLIFGTDTLNKSNAGAYSNFYLIKLDPNGNILWMRSAGIAFGTEGVGVDIDNSGNVYVTGHFNGDSVSFQGSAVFNHGPAGSNDIFIVKYDGAGNLIWAKSEGGAEDELTEGIACDLSNLYVSGFFMGSTITLGSTILSGTGGSEAFIAKFDLGGTIQWAKSAGGSGFDAGYGISVDASGNSFLAGTFTDITMVAGSITLTNANPAAEDVFVLKYDPSGNVIWGKAIGGQSFDNVLSIASDALGNSFITGSTSSAAMVLGPDSVGSGTNGNIDVYVAKLDPSGSVEWGKDAGNTGAEEGTSVAIAPSGAIMCMGYFNSDYIVFGNDTLVNFDSVTNYQDIFIAAIDITTEVVRSRHEGFKVSAFPNPNKGRFFIESSSLINKIEAVNILGEIVYSRTSNAYNSSIDISGNPAGFYFIRLFTEAGESTIKISLHND